MSQSPENRIEPRIELILKIAYPTAEDFAADYTHNAGGGGLFIATRRSFQLGEHLVFDISFPGLLAAMRCEGEVRWIRSPEQEDENQPAGIGVAFCFPDEEQGEKVRSLIKKLCAHEDDPVEAAPAEAPPFRVLLAEDNPLMRQMFRFAVRKFHNTYSGSGRKVEVAEAANGHEALAHLQSHSFDLAIIDYYMPLLDGGKLVRKIRENEKFNALPIIMVSAGGKDARVEAFDAGSDLYLDKPVLLGQLFESLQRLLKFGDPLQQGKNERLKP